LEVAINTIEMGIIKFNQIIDMLQKCATILHGLFMEGGLGFKLKIEGGDMIAVFGATCFSRIIRL